MRVNRFGDVCREILPVAYTGAWRAAFPFDGFGPLNEHHFSVGHTGSPEDVIVNRVRSISFVAALGADEREKIDNELHALIADEPLLACKDVITLPYETAAFYVEKLAR